MKRVFSVEEIPESFWVASIAGAEHNTMNRSQSEWFFEKFFQELPVPETSSTAGVSDQRPDSIPRESKPPSSDEAPVSSPVPSLTRKDGEGGGEDGGGGVARGDDGVLEVKGPVPSSVVQHLRTEPTACADPEEYAVYLKQKLDIYCAAVAKTRGSGIISQGDPLLESRPPFSDSSKLGSDVSIRGSQTIAAPALPFVKNSVVRVDQVVVLLESILMTKNLMGK
ncbi:hypothetical protein HPP92_010248 [Vanilla planifolia]|uniref:Uncharacterized protein n=1 Tax=Vanilla planifolia TaxID=51239 RepID=A0A835QTI6_VANPL|nr:hypothetical protein HPP92_010248 [Vanilla planifolia]